MRSFHVFGAVYLFMLMEQERESSIIFEEFAAFRDKRISKRILFWIIIRCAHPSCHGNYKFAAFPNRNVIAGAHGVPAYVGTYILLLTINVYARIYLLVIKIN